MANEYNNLNAQNLHDKFVDKYNEKYKNADKKDLPGLLTKIKSYFMFSNSLINLLLIVFTLVLYFLCKKTLYYWTIIIFGIIILILRFLVYYFSSFSNIEKLLAEQTIDEVFYEEKIILTEKSLKRIIKDSRNVASVEGDIFKETNKILSNSASKVLIYSFFGIIVAYISFLNEKSSVDQFFEDLEPLFKFYFILFVIFVVIFSFVYCVDKDTNRKKELYLEVLEDKRLTLCLRNKETVESAEEEIKDSIEEDDMRQEK